jgi:hypothetical protein
MPKTALPDIVYIPQMRVRFPQMGGKDVMRLVK